MPVSKRKGPLNLPSGGLIVFGVKRPKAAGSEPEDASKASGKSSPKQD